MYNHDHQRNQRDRKSDRQTKQKIYNNNNNDNNKMHDRIQNTEYRLQTQTTKCTQTQTQIHEYKCVNRTQQNHNNQNAESALCFAL